MLVLQKLVVLVFIWKMIVVFCDMPIFNTATDECMHIS